METMKFNFADYNGFYIIASSYNFIEHLLILTLLKNPESFSDSLKLTISNIYNLREERYHDLDAESFGNMEAIKVNADTKNICINTGDAMIQFQFTSTSTVEIKR